jgi:Sec-independent protein translocase protein TatA
MIRAHKLVESIGDTLVFSVSNNIFLPVRRHRRLFLDLMALPAVLSAAFYLFKCLAVAPDDVVATAGLYPSLLDMSIYDFMATWLESDHRLLPVAYLVAGIVVRLVTYVATISAAVAAARYESGQEWEEELEQEHDNEEENEEEEEEEEMEEEEEETEKERQHYTLLSFLGTVKSNLARPAKIICSNWALSVALDFLLGKLGQGVLDKAEFIYPAMLVIFLVHFICEVAVIVSGRGAGRRERRGAGMPAHSGQVRRVPALPGWGNCD